MIEPALLKIERIRQLFERYACPPCEMRDDLLDSARYRAKLAVQWDRAAIGRDRLAERREAQGKTSRAGKSARLRAVNYRKAATDERRLADVYTLAASTIDGGGHPGHEAIERGES